MHVDLIESVEKPHEAALLAEAALAHDWLRPEEDAAWAHLQSENGGGEESLSAASDS